MGLAWDLVGFQDLLKQVSELKKACLELETAHDVNDDLQEFRTSLLLYTKQLFMKKRVAATHLHTCPIHTHVQYTQSVSSRLYV